MLTFGGGQSATGGLTTIADNADISSATAGKFSFELPSSLLTNFALNEGVTQLVDVSVKGVADPSASGADNKSMLNIRILIVFFKFFVYYLDDKSQNKTWRI